MEKGSKNGKYIAIAAIWISVAIATIAAVFFTKEAYCLFAFGAAIIATVIVVD